MFAPKRPVTADVIRTPQHLTVMQGSLQTGPGYLDTKTKHESKW